MKKTIPCTIVSKRIKYSRINVKTIENYRTLIKKINDNLKKAKDTTHPLTEKLDIVNMAILPKLVKSFNTIPTRILNAFFTEMDTLTSKFIWNYKRPILPPQKNLENNKR